MHWYTLRVLNRWTVVLVSALWGVSRVPIVSIHTEWRDWVMKLVSSLLAWQGHDRTTLTLWSLSHCQVGDLLQEGGTNFWKIYVFQTKEHSNDPFCYLFLVYIDLVEFITIGPNHIMGFRITLGPLKAYIELHIYGLWTLQVISK